MLLEQDLYVLLNLAVNPQRRWTFSSLSQDLLISPSQLHLGLNRANLSGLYHFDERRVVKSALEEFVIHGVRYAYPAEKGPIIRGMRPLLLHLHSKCNLYLLTIPTSPYGTTQKARL